MTHWLDEWNQPDHRLNRLVSLEDGSTVGVEKTEQTTGVVVPLDARLEAEHQEVQEVGR